MEQYYEQSVASQPSLKKNLLYGFCWALIALLVLIALFFAANAIGDDPGKFSINWPGAVMMLVCLSLVYLLFVRKDYLRMEYDYIFQDGVLEVFGVMNARRRKKLARIELRRVSSAGNACPSDRDGRKIKCHKWYAEKCRNHIVYMENNIRHLALLELDDELMALARRRLPAGAWRSEEGKN